MATVLDPALKVWSLPLTQLQYMMPGSWVPRARLVEHKVSLRTAEVCGRSQEYSRSSGFLGQGLIQQMEKQSSRDLQQRKLQDDMAPVELFVDVPAVFMGYVIGKGGCRKKELEERHHVRLCPSANKPLRVRGASKNCQECQQEIQELVKSQSRGPTGAKKGKGKCTKCLLCNKELSSPAMRQMLDHIGSLRHLQALDLLKEMRLDLDELQQLLEDPWWRSRHVEAGFQVDELIKTIGLEKARLEGLNRIAKEVCGLSPDPFWLNIETRVVVQWDDRSSVQSPWSKAPCLLDMMDRCEVRTPPVARVPKLPAPLPRVDQRLTKQNRAKGSHQYPADPGSGRLGIAIIQKLGLELKSYDFVCGTSFIKALAGDSQRCGDSYYLQKFKQTVCVLHVPKHYFNQDDAGHAVERLLCGQAPREFIAATSLVVDGSRFMVTSEVDASDQRGNLVEIKSSKHKKLLSAEIALQIAVNGSKSLLFCELDESQSQVLETHEIFAEEVLKSYRDTLTVFGQRVRLMLRKVREYLDEYQDESVVLRLTFDGCKLPCFSAANVSVLPLGLH